MSSVVSEHVARLEGLPFKVTKAELVEFFAECDVTKGEEGVHLILNHEGRASGLGFVEFGTAAGLEAGVQLSNKNIASYGRYAKISECPTKEFQWYLNRMDAGTESKKFRVRMRGLPYRVTEYEVAQWFAPEASCSDVEIHLNSDGRSSGIATAFFDSREDAENALKKHNADMHHRYIALSLESEDPMSRHGFFIRMGGIPFRASDEELKEFFLPAKCVSVRIIFNSEGRPSGNAIAEFESEADALQAMEKDRETLGKRFVILTRVDASGYNLNEDGGGESNGERRGRNSGGTGGRGFDADSEGRGSFAVRMSGLPFRVTVEEIKEWFNPEATCSHARLLMNRDGRPSGEAVAEFATQEEADQALTKNRQNLGSRYVILKAQY